MTTAGMLAIPSKIMVSMRGLSKRYGSHLALDGVDLDIGTGVTGILGRNGAGKTTLLGCIATAHEHDAGALEILGRDPAALEERTEIRRRLGYLPQVPDFYPHFTVFALLDYLAILKELGGRRQRHDEIRRVLAAVDLYDRRHSRLRKLSGGMRQRVGLAGALLGDPRLLLLDEPTIGLDPEQRIRFRDLVSEFAANRSVVLSTHQIEDVAAVCERVVVLDRGRVAFAGAPGALTEHARGRVWSLPARPDNGLAVWRSPTGTYRVLTAEADVPPAGAESLATTVEPTLEDGYLLLTGAVRVPVAGRAA